MSTIQIEDESWKAIMADPQLQRARQKLSFNEIRLIVDHARAHHLPRKWAETIDTLTDEVERLRDSRLKPLVETTCGLDAKHESDGAGTAIAPSPSNHGEHP